MSILKHYIKLAVSITVGLTIISENYTNAAGSIGVESTGFLRTSNDRSDSSYLFSLGPEFEIIGNNLEGKFQLKALSYFNDPSSITLESKNAYISTSKKLIDGVQFSAGRRQYDWSISDDTWKYGLWSPRFMWDPMRPEQIGLTGAFYTYETSNWRVLAYGSAVSIPERSYPIQNVNGKISSNSPYYRPLPDTVALLNKPVDINYRINTPRGRDILMRPAGAVNARYGREHGYWGSVGYGLMAIHQTDLAVDAALNLSALKMDVDVYPRFPMHQLLTIENGYKQDWWGMWASISGEQPLPVETKSNWISNKTGPAMINSVGGNLKWQEGLNLSSSYLFVLEQDRGLNGPPIAAGLNVNLPDRFAYRRAWLVDGSWDSGNPTTYDMKWIQDAENQSSQFSFDLNYKPRWAKKIYKYEQWVIGFGADFIASPTGKGTIGQYKGDDRIRGGITYAF